MKKLPKSSVLFLVLKIASIIQTCVILVTANPNARTKPEALRLPVALTFATIFLI